MSIPYLIEVGGFEQFINCARHIVILCSSEALNVNVLNTDRDLLEVNGDSIPCDCYPSRALIIATRTPLQKEHPYY